MPKLKFRGASIESISMRGKSNGFMVTATIRADLSKPVIDAMHWDKLLTDQQENSPAWESIALTGEIPAGEFAFSPNKDLANLAFGLKFDTIKSFTAHFVEDREGNAEEFLTFKLRTSSPGAEAKLGRYWRAMKEQGATLDVEYAEQAPVPENDAADAGIEE